MADSLGSSSSEAVNSVQAQCGCGCCCFEFLIENMVQCKEGHRFCFGCVRRQVEETIYGSFKGHASLPCMHTDYNCKQSIPFLEIRRALPDDVIERYEQCQAREAAIEAKLENLVYCPFCSIPCEVDKCVQVFDCPNPKCLMASCIKCKEPSHIPLRCEEIEQTSATAARRKIEERMTKAVIRECKTCEAEIVKIGGCNRVTCTRCRTTMCYVCRHAISSSYEHFCSHNYPREAGKPCQICKVDKCSLWETEIEDNVALDAREEALKEFGDNDPNLFDQKIGPPLVKQTVQPSNRQLVFPDDDVNVYRDFHGNEGRRLDFDARQYFQQLLAPNIAIPLPAVQQLVGNQIPLPPNMAIPLPVAPPEIVRADDEQLQDNIQLVGNQNANMAIPLPVAPPEIVRGDDEVANMQLQANEADGTQEDGAEDKVGDLQSN